MVQTEPLSNSTSALKSADILDHSISAHQGHHPVSSVDLDEPHSGGKSIWNHRRRIVVGIDVINLFAVNLQPLTEQFRLIQTVSNQCAGIFHHPATQCKSNVIFKEQLN